MGWCSGTPIFDAVAGAVLGKQKVAPEKILRIVAEALEDADWDCQSDSDYYDHPVVRKMFCEMHPDWEIEP